MNWTNELILLAPRILENRKPLEHSSFIGLYTAIENEYSEGFIYLVYQFKNVNELKDIEGLLNNNEYYYDKRFLRINDLIYTVFVFKYKDITEIEEYKRFGTTGFTLSDYILIYTFWGDLSKEIPNLSFISIKNCERIFRCKSKGLQ